MERRAKIVCTLGPASWDEGTLSAMVEAGMDVARLNTSHGTMEEHLQVCALVRRVSARLQKPVAVLLDLGGPKLRTGPTTGGKPVDLVAGTTVRLTTEHVEASSLMLTVEYPRLLEDVAAGDPVLLDDGQIELVVTRVAADGVECFVKYGGQLGPNKGVSFPESNLTTPILTDRDHAAIHTGVEAEVDFFGLSFVRNAADVADTRRVIEGLGADIPIIAKIERRQAVSNLDAILAEADGAMVARGDLGVELPPEDVPVQQRRIIEAARRHKIPVITATQMLESMVNSPRPTRAESSDVANAVWDMSDALMLSGETAIGRFPVRAVEMMDRIIRSAERSPGLELEPATNSDADDHPYVVALAVRRIVQSDPNMRAVVCFTKSGYSAFLMSKVHLREPIFAISPNEAVVRRLALARGVQPIQGVLVSNADEMFAEVDRTLVERGLLQRGDEVVIVASMPVHASGTTNFLKLHRVGEGEAHGG
jgi:pyruvate kinase